MSDHETCVVRSNTPGQPDRHVRIFAVPGLHPAIRGVIDTRRLADLHEVDVVVRVEHVAPALSLRAG